MHLQLWDRAQRWQIMHKCWKILLLSNVCLSSSFHLCLLSDILVWILMKNLFSVRFSCRPLWRNFWWNRSHSEESWQLSHSRQVTIMWRLSCGDYHVVTIMWWLSCGDYHSWQMTIMWRISEDNKIAHISANNRFRAWTIRQEINSKKPFFLEK